MPDAFGRLTPEEERAIALRQSPAPLPGATRAAMKAPMQVNPERAQARERAAQDFSGQERKIKNQREYANMLRSQGAPQGRRVGPSDLYVAPNWGEVAAGVGGQLLGGYMAGKANESDEDLDTRRLDKAKAAQELEEMKEAEARQDMLDERARQQANYESTQAALTDERKLARETSAQAAQKKEEARIAGINAKILDEGAKEMNEEVDRKREMAKEVRDEYKETMSDVREAAAGGDLTEAQAKHKFQADMLGNAITDIEEVLDTGYNTAGLAAYKDKLTGMTDFTRWATSEEGLKFKSASNTAKEQILRAATGAAAPESENKEYIETLVPRIGEGPEVVAYKLQKMKEAQKLLSQLGGDRWNEAISISRSTYDPPEEEGGETPSGNRREQRAQRARASRTPVGGLSAEEQRELEELEQQFGG